MLKTMKTIFFYNLNVFVKNKKNKKNKIRYNIVRDLYYTIKKNNLLYFLNSKLNFIHFILSNVNGKSSMENMFLKKWFFLKVVNEFNK